MDDKSLFQEMNRECISGKGSKEAQKISLQLRRQNERF
jgi:hypothetical protein